MITSKHTTGELRGCVSRKKIRATYLAGDADERSSVGAFLEEKLSFTNVEFDVLAHDGGRACDVQIASVQDCRIDGSLDSAIATCTVQVRSFLASFSA